MFDAGTTLLLEYVGNFAAPLPNWQMIPYNRTNVLFCSGSLMAKQRKRTTTYRTEFASLPPSQQQQQLNLLQQFLVALGLLQVEEIREQQLRPRRVSRRDRS